LTCHGVERGGTWLALDRATTTAKSTHTQEKVGGTERPTAPRLQPQSLRSLSTPPTLNRRVGRVGQDAAEWFMFPSSHGCTQPCLDLRRPSPQGFAGKARMRATRDVREKGEEGWLSVWMVGEGTRTDGACGPAPTSRWQASPPSTTPLHPSRHRGQGPPGQQGGLNHPFPYPPPEETQSSQGAASPSAPSRQTRASS